MRLNLCKPPGQHTISFSLYFFKKNMLLKNIILLKMYIYTFFSFLLCCNAQIFIQLLTVPTSQTYHKCSGLPVQNPPLLRQQ